MYWQIGDRVWNYNLISCPINNIREIKYELNKMDEDIDTLTELLIIGE